MRLSNTTEMTTAAVRQWLQKHYQIPHAFQQQGLRFKDLSIDHVLPTAIGGVDHPFNYFIMPKEINSKFDCWWMEKKRSYIGEANARVNKEFLLWVRAEGKRWGIDYNAFDPKRHKY